MVERFWFVWEIQVDLHVQASALNLMEGQFGQDETRKLAGICWDELSMLFLATNLVDIDDLIMI